MRLTNITANWLARPTRCRQRKLAFILFAILATPAAATAIKDNAASLNLVQPQADSHYDPAFRTLYIGAFSQPPSTDSDIEITTGRAADLVGRPLKLVHTSPVAKPTLFGRGGSIPSSLPFSASAITSGFGMRMHPILGGWRAHTGIDLAAPLGSPVAAASNGVVTKADWAGGYGLYVSLDNGSGIQTRYGHMSRLNVAAGQLVHVGDIIGYVGSTGRSTGPHLHYELRVNGQAIDPVSAQRSH